MTAHRLATSPPLPARSHDTATAAARDILVELFGPPADRDFDVRLWDGSVDEAGRPPARFMLVIRRPDSLRRMFLPPTDRRLGEAWIRNDFDVEGSLEAATALGEPVLRRIRSGGRAWRLFRLLRRLPTEAGPEPGLGPQQNAGAQLRRPRRGRLHSRDRDAAAVRYHYDVGNDFYALWLDRRMVYSCAYFPTGAEDLDAAQEAKLELVCRKLRLRPGERLLDIGCGWGALVLHAAERYGVEAVGITLSEPQAAFARDRIAAAGLADRCRIEVRDQRELPKEWRFDKIASIGMVEHVGLAVLPDYFARAFRLLHPGGLFLNHGIIRLGAPRTRLDWWIERRVRPLMSFTGAYVFPDGELVSPAEMLAPAEAAGFELRDLESLREHYARTLRHWSRGLEQHRDEAIALAGEAAYRIWRLHHAGAAHGFDRGRNGLVQMLLARRHEDGSVRLPPTRADLYSR
jgi:cyclopropane-fatty-acyl-phospholipid synthase